jgi:hypothetical protein
MWVALSVTFGVVFLIVIVALIVSVSFAMRYGRMVLNWEQSIDEAMNQLDESYQAMSRIRNTPVFVNSPEVQQLMMEVDRAREAVLWTATALSLPARGAQKGRGDSPTIER